MSLYYNPKNTNNTFNPKSSDPFKLSRSKLDLFLNCPLCFYFDRRKGIGRPPGFPFSLNSAVDKLLKKEFDIHRANKTRHPLMETYKIDAVPLSHEDISKWRNNLRGIQYLDPATNFLVYGAVDDIWVNQKGEYIIVDYKATSKDGEVNIDSAWQIAYKRQMEIYQWLFRKNGFKVSDTGYFVYCNGNTDKEAFDGKLEFDVKIIPYKGSTDWIEKILLDARKCLVSSSYPESSKDCDYCAYRESVKDTEAGDFN